MTALDLTSSDYRALADFRYRIRQFLHFSEGEARKEGLEPQQHQMLLAIRALSDSGDPTVGELAGHLLVRHHSAVGLIDRLEDRDLVERCRTSEDRRQVRVRLTAKGQSVLEHLAGAHRDELRKSGPQLVRILGGLLRGTMPE